MIYKLSFNDTNHINFLNFCTDEKLYNNKTTKKNKIK